MLRKLGGHAYMWAATVDPGRRALLVGLCGRGTFINRLGTAEVPTPSWLKIPYNGGSYSATFLSNSSLLDFSFNQATSSFIFTVTGNAGSRASANVSMPTNLIAAPYSLSLDGSTLSPLSTRNLPAKNITQILVSYPLDGKPQLLVVRGSLVTTTTSSTTSTQSSTTTSTSIVSSASSSSTTLSSTSTFTSLTTTSSSVSSQTTVSTSSETHSPTGTSSGGGILEFPPQALLLTVFSMLVAASYAVVRSGRPHP